MIAGIAAGLARWTGFDVTVVRVVLVLATLASGVGAIAYALGWLLIPRAGEQSTIAVRALADRRGVVLVASLVPPLVLALVVTSMFGIPYLSTAVWSCFVGGAALILVYRNADEGERVWLRQAVEPLAELGSGRTRSRRVFALRLVAGVALALAGLVFLVLGHSTLSALRPLAGASLLAAAVLVLFGPWWLHLARQLVAERQARVRAEERADMAARVHDSVLQTLALIQRSSGDPLRVSQLARSQERELRSWLFEGGPPAPGAAGDDVTLGSAIEQVAREVEELHQVAVDDVTVGDCPQDDDVRALVAAAREAAMNAAKWSGAPVVSIYAEVEPQRVSAYVRDRGAGFVPAEVGADRRGIAESIRGRMARHGGSASVRSAPGQGTEVELVLPRRSGRNAR